MKKLLVLLFLIVATLSVTFAAKITDDVLNVGKAGNDFSIIHKDGGFLKKESGTGNWIFSNDGLLEKKFGSGSGAGGAGGVNILVNSSFEDGLVNWTNSGGTFTQQTFTNSVEGNTKYSRFVATAAGQYIETDLTTFADSISGGVMADFKYFQGDDAFDFLVIDNGATVISSQAIADITEWQKVPTATMDLPTSAKIRIISTAAGTIEIDDAYLGSNRALNEAILLDHFEVLAGGTVPATYTADTPIRVDTIVSDPDNLYNVSNGEFTAPAESIYNFSFYFNTNVLGDSKTYVSVDGVKKADCLIQHSSSGLIAGTCAVKANSGQIITLRNELSWTASGPGSSLYIAYQKPSQEILNTYTPEQANFLVNGIEGNITGTTNIIPSVSSTPIVWQHSALTMAVSRGSAKIGCSGGNPATGLTCSVGNEEISAVAYIPAAGVVDVCFNASLFSGSTTETVSRVAMTDAPNSSTVSQIGVHTLFVNGANVEGGSTVCGRFDINSIGDRKFVLSYESNTVDANLKVITNANNYDKGVSFSIRAVGHNVSRPIFQNMVDTSDQNKRVNECYITNSGTPAFGSDSCNSWIDSITDVGVGNIILNLKTGVFSEGPSCQFSSLVQDRCASHASIATTSSQVKALTASCSTNSIADVNFYITCTGRK